MKICLACKSQVPDIALRCPKCGSLIPKVPARGVRKQQTASTDGTRILRIILLGVAGAALVVGWFWFFRVSPRLKAISGEVSPIRPDKPKNVKAEYPSGSEFDLALDLPSDPLGLVWSGDFLIGNRKGGIFRAKQNEDEFELQQIPVVEKRYQQPLSFWALAWNGSNYVGVVSGDYFQSGSKTVFTIHDPHSLEVIRHVRAPDQIGCLVWTGDGYWAATRKNTQDSPEKAYLYRIDPEFNIESESDAPAAGCQGLAWDGSNLWLADVFSDNIYVLNVNSAIPSVVGVHNTRFSYLSGITYDGKTLWVTDYNENKLRRLNTQVFAQWRPVSSQPYSPPGTTPPVAVATVGETPAEKQTTDVYESRSDDYSDEEEKIIRCAVQIERDTLHGSWEIFFHEDLFIPNVSSAGIEFPIFHKYTFTITGGSLTAPVTKEYLATPGLNSYNNALLAENLGPGKYDVSLFVHVQYVNQEGTNRVLNDSMPTLHVEN